MFNAKNGKELKVYRNDYLVGGQISSNFKGKRSNFSFGRLLALMAGHPENGYYRIIDGDKPLTLDNITTLKDYMKTSTSSREYKKIVPQEQPSIIAMGSNGGEGNDGFDILIEKDKIKNYFLNYVPCEDNIQYKTEDGLIFTDRVKALQHQLSIDKGKELAHVVIQDKGGWVLAEKMYLSQVNYYDGKPLNYNFKTIFESTEGIQEIGDKTYLVEEAASGTHQFKTKEEMEKWLKAKALIDMVIDYRYNPARIASLIS